MDEEIYDSKTNNIEKRITFVHLKSYDIQKEICMFFVGIDP